MKPILAIAVAIALLPVVAFCVFGSMATFEPTDRPGVFMAFRIGYGVGGVGCLVVVGCLFWWAFHSSRISS